jgi:AGCS family alanine or glycine:cation symporter
MAEFAELNATINSFVWGPVMLAFIVGVGVYYTFRMKWFQITYFGTWNRETIVKMFASRKAAEGAVTPFQAFCTAMAATAGVGNLVGVAGSIIGGGPGALFWMCLSGFFGMVTKYAEILLAVHFRERNHDGEWVGGPMYYITNGLGKGWVWLAVIFAFLGAVCAFGIGNMTQINAAVGTFERMLADLEVMTPAPAHEFSAFRLGFGIVLAVLVGLVVVGGMQRIAHTAEFCVPFAGIFCIIGSIIAIAINADQLGYAFRVIFVGAFTVEAAASGVFGYAIMQAIRFGVARGVFTNEAGLGSAPIAHAAADVDHPAKQGMWGCFEVFADTLIMCALTAFVILTYGIAGGIEVVDGVR